MSYFRDPTDEEREHIRKYIESISIPTGFNIFDFLNDVHEASDEIASCNEDTNGRTQTNDTSYDSVHRLNKYINAEQLKKEFPHNNDWDYPVNTNSYVVELIDSTPYIDLVYCKDCIYRPLKEDPDDEPCKFNLIAPTAGRRCPCLVADGWYSWMPPDNFYCAYGKRKGE